MRTLIASALVLAAISGKLLAQEDGGKRKTAVIQWVADAPVLVYDIRFTGDGTTMPTALKYLLKDLAEGEGFYLTGEDKSKTVASQAKRISLEYTPTRSKPRPIRTAKIEIKELDSAITCVVTYLKKPAKDDVTRTGDMLETFGRKYLKTAKNAPATVEPAATARASVWSFDIRFKEPPAKDKK
jgi:hypothetical protein